MNTKTETHLKKLISYKTVSSNPTEIQSCLRYIKTHLIDTSTCIVKEYKNNNKPSLIISTHNTKNPDIAFLCHIDVVSAPEWLFHMKKRNRKYYGRGVSDMKFSIPIFTDILRHAHTHYPHVSLALILTSDEECGGEHGAKYIANTIKYRPKILLIPDGGNNWQLVSNAKGVLHISIALTGKSAHASKPWNGISANDRAIALLTQLRNIYPQLEKKRWNSITMNIGILSGGTSTNQIPDICEIKLDFRYPTIQDRHIILSNVKKLLTKKDTISVLTADVFTTPVQNHTINLFLNIAKKSIKRIIPITKDFGTSDARFFSIYNIPCIMIKPACGGEHAANEWMSIKGMKEFYKIIHIFIQQYSAQKNKSSLLANRGDKPVQ